MDIKESPQPTSETSFDSNATDDSISQPDDSVKSKLSDRDSDYLDAVDLADRIRAAYENLAPYSEEGRTVADMLEKVAVVIEYDKKKMNGKYQVGSGRIVVVTHDTPFIVKHLPRQRRHSTQQVRRLNRNGGGACCRH